MDDATIREILSGMIKEQTELAHGDLNVFINHCNKMTDFVLENVIGKDTWGYYTGYVMICRNYIYMCQAYNSLNDFSNKKKCLNKAKKYFEKYKNYFTTHDADNIKHLIMAFSNN